MLEADDISRSLATMSLFKIRCGHFYKIVVFGIFSRELGQQLHLSYDLKIEKKLTQCLPIGDDAS